MIQLHIKPHLHTLDESKFQFEINQQTQIASACSPWLTWDCFEEPASNHHLLSWYTRPGSSTEDDLEPCWSIGKEHHR